MFIENLNLEKLKLIVRDIVSNVLYIFIQRLSQKNYSEVQRMRLSAIIVSTAIYGRASHEFSENFDAVVMAPSCGCVS